MTERKSGAKQELGVSVGEGATATQAEGAPKLETPEKPAEVPEEAPRDEKPELETPEEPSVKLDSRQVSEALQQVPRPQSKVRPVAPPRATATETAIVANLVNGPTVVSADEANLIISQHNL